jgi:hypothetical protein
MLGSPTAWDNMMTKTEVCSATANQAQAEFLGPPGFLLPPVSLRAAMFYFVWVVEFLGAIHLVSRKGGENSYRDINLK